MNPRPETSGGSRSHGRSAADRAPEHERGEVRVEREQPEEVEMSAGGALGSAAPPEPAEGVEASAEAVEEDLKTALASSRNERDEYLDMLRRLQADFENYKKRMLRQQTELLERAAEGLVVRLLPALDAFDLAREHLGDSEDLSAEGKALVQASALLFDTLAKEGLERMEDLGEPFDPTRHEAVEHVLADEANTEDVGESSSTTDVSGPVVVGVLRAGYRWKGKVIRPAMVRVRG